MKKNISRPNPQVLPSLNLPFHLHATGCNEAPPGWRENHPGIIKNFVQVFWTVRGRGEFTFPDRVVNVNANEVIIRYPGEDHIHCSSHPLIPWFYYWVTFDGPGAEAFMRSFGYPRKPLPAGECPVRLFSELESLLKIRTLYAQRHALSLIMEILALAGEQHSHSTEIDPVRRFVEQVSRFFPDASMTVASLSSELGVHRTTLNRLFEKQYGMSPGKYIDQVRLQRALTLLAETDLRNKEIAEECGINDESYFCRLVRESTGMTPLVYRKQC